VVREEVGAGVRNDPNLVCTYEYEKKKKYSACFSSTYTKIGMVLVQG
jgi:hypothetical protein